MSPIEQGFRNALEADRFDAVSHFAFADFLEEHGRDDEALPHRTWTREWQEAEDWLREFLADVYSNVDYDGNKWGDGITYDTVMEQVQAGEGLHFYGFDTPDRCYADRKEFERNVAIVTGRRDADPPSVSFSCSC